MSQSNRGARIDRLPHPSDAVPPADRRLASAAMAKAVNAWDAWQSVLLGKVIDGSPQVATSRARTLRQRGPDATVAPPLPAGPAPACTYLVSDALPLHRLGLVPPPVEIGPHLLAAAPLEVAAAAADKTAQEMARAPAIIAFEPQPLDTSTAPAIATGASTVGDDAETGMFTDFVDSSSDETPLATTTLDDADSPRTAAALWWVPPDLPPAAYLEERTETFRIAQKHAPASKLEQPEWGATDTNSASAVTLRTRAFDVGSSILPKLGHPIMSLRMSYEKYRSESADQDSGGDWPGFLTGFVMAVAIGLGLYMSLTGS